jgi:hypothetical protein
MTSATARAASIAAGQTNIASSPISFTPPASVTTSHASDSNRLSNAPKSSGSSPLLVLVNSTNPTASIGWPPGSTVARRRSASSRRRRSP